MLKFIIWVIFKGHIDFLQIMVTAHMENEESESQAEKNCGTVKINRGKFAS